MSDLTGIGNLCGEIFNLETSGESEVGEVYVGRESGRTGRSWVSKRDEREKERRKRSERDI